MAQLLVQEDTFWCQRAKTHCYTMGTLIPIFSSYSRVF